MEADRKFWFKWILYYSLGDLLAIAAAAVIGGFLFIDFSNRPLTPFTTTAILVIAGASEGLIIGYIQWKSLSRVLLHFKPIPWIATTTISAIAGWLLFLPPAIMLISFLTKSSLINNYYSILYTALVGILFGTLMGVPQFIFIRKFYKNAFVWILANVFGWMFSFLIIYSAILMLTDSGLYIYNLSLILISCVLSGLIQGLITGTSLHFLMSVKIEHLRKSGSNQFPLSISLK